MKPRYLLVLFPLAAALSVASVNATITYYKDILPILQTHCLSCHGANPIAPIAFRTYRETRPWAEAIEDAITARKMPPSWGAEERWLPKENHGGLTAQEIATIVAWVEQGAVAGDPQDAPPPFGFDRARQNEPYQDALPKGSPELPLSEGSL
jgi:mono/diheme cytochrome c family protein